MGSVRQVIVLTDGQVSNEPAVVALAKRHQARNRIFTFGIGNACSAAMVNGLAGYRSVWWQQDLWKTVRARKGTADQLPILRTHGLALAAGVTLYVGMSNLVAFIPSSLFPRGRCMLRWRQLHSSDWTEGSYPLPRLRPLRAGPALASLSFYSSDWSVL